MKIKDTNLNYTLNVVARWVVGLVFLFSSFVKGVDPLGTVYKVQDYMSNWELFGMTFEWAHPMAGVLAVALICAEFIVGVMLIFNSFRVFTAWMLTLMMLFFTVTTFVDATTNLVDDCGCFGDAIKLTNWQTFWKNVALDVPTAWILLTCRLRAKRRFERDCLVFLGALAVMLIFCIYNIKHEPVIDFRPWKIGNKMIDTELDAAPKSYVTYRNVQTGETMEFESAKLMDYMADSTWEQQWEWASSRVEMPEIKAAGFSMMDMLMEDHAFDLILSEEGLVIITIHSLDKVDDKGVREVKLAQQLAAENGKQVVLLTSALPEEVQAWLYDNQVEGLDYLFADATAIKTMMRGNPGFMYIKDAVVVDKGRKAVELKMED